MPEIDAELDPAELNAMAEARPPEDRLLALRAGLITLRDKEAELADLNRRAEQVRKEVYELCHMSLVNQFQLCNMTVLGLEAEGNYPPMLAEMKPFVSAKIPEGGEETVFDFLTREGFGGSIKTFITIDLGLNTAEETAAIIAALERLSAQYIAEKTVHSGTLRVLARKLHEDGKLIPTEGFDPMAVLGAYVGFIVKLKPVKEG